MGSSAERTIFRRDKRGVSGWLKALRQLFRMRAHRTTIRSDEQEVLISEIT